MLLATFVASTILGAACSSSGSGDSATASPSPSPSPSPSSSATATPSATPTPVGAFSCLGTALPASASDPIVISGTVTTTDASGTTPVGSATVAAFKTGTSTALVSGVSSVSGAYSLTVPTSGLPVDGYLLSTKSGFLDTYVYPSEPASKTATVDVSMLTSSTFGFLQSFAGVTQNASKGAIIVEVVDCNGSPIAGATITSSPAGTVRYLSGGIPSSSATATDVAGVAFIFNVGPGDVSVMSTAGGNTLRAHTVNARAGSALTTTQIAPGPH